MKGAVQECKHLRAAYCSRAMSDPPRIRAMGESMTGTCEGACGPREGAAWTFESVQRARDRAAIEFAECDRALRGVVEAVRPRMVIGVGAFATERARRRLRVRTCCLRPSCTHLRQARLRTVAGMRPLAVNFGASDSSDERDL